MYYITLIIDITIIRVITITITLELLDSLTSYLLFVLSENCYSILQQCYEDVFHWLVSVIQTSAI